MMRTIDINDMDLAQLLKYGNLANKDDNIIGLLAINSLVQVAHFKLGL